MNDRENEEKMETDVLKPESPKETYEKAVTLWFNGLTALTSVMPAVASHVADLEAQAKAQVSALEVQVKKLEAFKAYTHSRLDGLGVPHTVPGEHLDAGCRVGGRFDALVDMLADNPNAVRMAYLRSLSMFTLSKEYSGVVLFSARGNGISGFSVEAVIDTALRVDKSNQAPASPPSDVQRCTVCGKYQTRCSDCG